MQQKVVENYILHEIIGSGQYGKVHRAINSKTNEVVAVKVIPNRKFQEVPKLEEFTTNEIKILGRISNPNVIRFIEMLKTVNNMYLVYEFCDGGTLENIITRKRYLNEIEALKIFDQLINAFKALYKENILHRDLKPSNILVHQDVIKIADFGFCKRLNNPSDLTLTMVGSPIYMAPEILKGYPYNIKSDIWSMGVVLFELLFGICPYEDKHLQGLIDQLDRKTLHIPLEINKISFNTENLLRRMLTKDHRQRIDWQELLDYPLNIETLEAEQTGKLIPKVLSEVSNTITSTNNNANLDKVQQITTEKKADIVVPKMTDNQYILHVLMKQRYRVKFLINVVQNILDTSYGNKGTVLAFLLCKKIINLLDSMKSDISIENSNSKYSMLPNWDYFRLSDEYIEFTRYLNEEFEEFTSYLNDFRNEILRVLDQNPNDPDFREHSNMKQELLTTTLDSMLLHNHLLNYVDDLKVIASSKMKTSINQDEQIINILLQANEVLDADSLDELFDKTLDYTLKYEEQEYFTGLKKAGKDKLLNMVQGKFNAAKMRSFQAVKINVSKRGNTNSFKERMIMQFLDKILVPK